MVTCRLAAKPRSLGSKPVPWLLHPDGGEVSKASLELNFLNMTSCSSSFLEGCAVSNGHCRVQLSFAFSPQNSVLLWVGLGTSQRAQFLSVAMVMPPSNIIFFPTV